MRRIQGWLGAAWLLCVPVTAQALHYEYEYNRNGDPAIPPPDDIQDHFDHQLFGEFEWTYVMFRQRNVDIQVTQLVNQVVPLSMINSTDRPWQIVARVELETPVPIGFVGIGSVDMPATLAPRSNHPLFIKIHALHALESLTRQGVRGHLTLTEVPTGREIDRVPFRLRRGQPQASLQLNASDFAGEGAGHHRVVLTNRAQRETVVELDFPQGALAASYGYQWLPPTSELTLPMRSVGSGVAVSAADRFETVRVNAARHDDPDEYAGLFRGDLHRWVGVHHLASQPFEFLFELPEVTWEYLEHDVGPMGFYYYSPEVLTYLDGPIFPANDPRLGYHRGFIAWDEHPEFVFQSRDNPIQFSIWPNQLDEQGHLAQWGELAHGGIAAYSGQSKNDATAYNFRTVWLRILLSSMNDVELVSKIDLTILEGCLHRSYSIDLLSQTELILPISLHDLDDCHADVGSEGSGTVSLPLTISVDGARPAHGLYLTEVELVADVNPDDLGFYGTPLRARLTPNPFGDDPGVLWQCDPHIQVNALDMVGEVHYRLEGETVASGSYRLEPLGTHPVTGCERYREIFDDEPADYDDRWLLHAPEYPEVSHRVDLAGLDVEAIESPQAYAALLKRVQDFQMARLAHDPSRQRPWRHQHHTASQAPFERSR